MEKDRKVIVGFKTVIWGLSLYIAELLSLPVFGTLQKAQVDGNGFYSDFGSMQESSPILPFLY